MLTAWTWEGGGVYELDLIRLEKYFPVLPES